jgi:hypothetical protein
MMMTQMDPVQAALCAAMATEIRAVRLLIEALAEVLASDERFALDYTQQFQTFDLVIQHVDEGAALLDRMANGEDVDATISLVRLDSMQQRLRAAITGA